MVVAFFRQRKTSICLLLILGSIVLMRIPSWFTPLWNMDEAVSACAANAILTGEIPYQDAIDHRGPVTYYAYALIFMLFGQNNMFAVHVWLSLMMTAVAGLVFWCGSVVANIRVGLWGAGFFMLLSFAFHETTHLLAAHTQQIVIFFTMAGTCFILFGISARQPLMTAISGVCYGIAFLTKQPALLNFAAVMAFLLAFVWKKEQSLRFLIWQIGLLGIGFVLPVGICLLYFFRRGALQDFWYYFWTYNTQIYVPEISLFNRLKTIPIPLNYLIKRFFPISTLFFAGTLVLPYRFFTERFSDTNTGKEYQFLFVITSWAALIGASLSGRTFGHYYIQCFPAVSLVAGITADELCTALRSCLRATCLEIHRSQRQLFHLVMIGSVLLMLLPVGRRFMQSLPEPPANTPVHQLIDYIQRHSAPDELIFVWGFYPEIYILANRHPASRYTFTNVLTGLIPWTNTAEERDTGYAIVPGSWDILLDELDTTRPALIIDTSPGDHRYYGKYPIAKFPRLAQFLDHYYTPTANILDKNGSSFRVFRKTL